MTDRPIIPNLVCPFWWDAPSGNLLQFDQARMAWRVCNPKPDNYGYRMCNWKDATGRRRFARMHAVVWRVSRGEWPPKGWDIDHIDNDATNNRPDNLQLLRRADNSRKMIQNRISQGRGPAPTKLFPHRKALAAVLPSDADWEALAARWKCHKVAVLGARCAMRKKMKAAGEAWKLL